MRESGLTVKNSATLGASLISMAVKSAMTAAKAKRNNKNSLDIDDNSKLPSSRLLLKNNAEEFFKREQPVRMSLASPHYKMESQSQLNPDDLLSIRAKSKGYRMKNQAQQIRKNSGLNQWRDAYPQSTN